MEEEGYYLCDNGHEKGGAFQPGADGESRKCIECNAPAKFIKRSEMSGQEKYESDKERKDAEQMAADKRKLAYHPARGGARSTLCRRSLLTRLTNHVCSYHPQSPPPDVYSPV
jgi:hypothetical protein